MAGDNGRIDITPRPGQRLEPVATVEERRQRLTEILRVQDAFPALIKTGHIISAIDTLNRMDGLYSVPFGFNDNRVINILCDARTADLIGKMADRTALPAANMGVKPLDVVPADTISTTDRGV